MKIFLIILLVVILVIAYFVFFGGKGHESEAKYITAEIKRGDIAITVTATGSLEAVTTVQVGSQISGTISALYADFNDHVKKGQILAQIDPSLLKAQVAQAEADLEKSQASAELAKENYDRSRSLFERKLISESDEQTAQTNYNLAKTDVKSSLANLNRLKTNLQYATIVSPIDGVVISRNVDVGQTVAASLQAPTLFTIAQDLTKMQVDTSVDEADIGNVHNGEEAIFTVDAYPQMTFDAKVNQVRLSPEIVQNVVSYDVILDVSNPHLLLKPGMTANVTILVEQRDSVLQVPAAALRFHPSEEQNGLTAAEIDSMRTAHASNSSTNPGASTPDHSGQERNKRGVIWLLDNKGKPKPVMVQVGISDGAFTQVTSDSLKAGDVVITGEEGVALSSGSQDVNPFLPRFHRNESGGRRGQ